MKMKKSRSIAIISIALLAMAIITIGCSTQPAQQPAKAAGYENVALTLDGESIKLISDDSGQYNPAIIRVKTGTRVRIEGDPETLVGGMDTVVIEGFGIRKKISAQDNIVEFTANKPGVYTVVCANGMGNGQLIVET